VLRSATTDAAGLVREPSREPSSGCRGRREGLPDSPASVRAPAPGQTGRSAERRCAQARTDQVRKQLFSTSSRRAPLRGPRGGQPALGPGMRPLRADPGPNRAAAQPTRNTDEAGKRAIGRSTVPTAPVTIRREAGDYGRGRDDRRGWLRAAPAWAIGCRPRFRSSGRERPCGTDRGCHRASHFCWSQSCCGKPTTDPRVSLRLTATLTATWAYRSSSTHLPIPGRRPCSRR
jgi:hypothetical protein